MKYANLIPAALAALAIVAPVPAAAQGANSDIRCLVVSNLFAKAAKEAKAKEVASSAMLFYGGRVSALSNAQIEAGLLAQGKLVTAANAPTTMNECAQAMNRGVQKLQTVGQSVSQKSQQPKAR